VVNKKVPMAWTAPECLQSLLWNQKSDVWSFGVLMWELFSFGSRPTLNHPAQKQLQALKGGERLNRPDVCPEDVWKMLRNCWDWDPVKRPNFLELQKNLKQIVEDINDLPPLLD